MVIQQKIHNKKEEGKMMKTTKTIFHKALSMLLIAGMTVTLFILAAPTETQAAGLSFKGKGTSTVIIKEKQCYTGKSYAINYIRYKPSVTGTVTLKFQNASKAYADSYGHVTFCDKRKKPIGQSNEQWHNGRKGSAYYTSTYGVKKNQTYYFAVICSNSTKITATTKKINDTSESSIEEAKYLPINKKTTGVIVAGDSKADWYKITLTTGAKLKLTYEAQTNGSNSANGFKVTFYDRNGEMWTENAYSYITRFHTKDGWDIHTKDDNDLKQNIEAGSYYVKVERMSKASSGSYTLNWNAYN